MIHAQLTRAEKVTFREKDHVLRNHSEDHKIGPVVRTGLKGRGARGNF